MISSISKIEHEKFKEYMAHTLRKFNQIEIPIEDDIENKCNELEDSAKKIEALYLNYVRTTSELRQILDTYEKTRHQSRKTLRKLQLWLKFTYPKAQRNFFKHTLQKLGLKNFKSYSKSG